MHMHLILIDKEKIIFFNHSKKDKKVKSIKSLFLSLSLCSCKYNSWYVGWTTYMETRSNTYATRARLRHATRSSYSYLCHNIHTCLISDRAPRK